MFDVVFGIILNLLAFTLIGIGPSLFLLSSENRLEAAAAIAPAFGFAMTSIACTYLTLLDYPVSDWTGIWLVAGAFISLVLCVAAFLKGRARHTSVNRQFFLFLAVGIVVTMILVTTPMVIGGLHFTVLRGNGADSFNYITLGRYLDHEPYSWAKSASFQALIDRDPSYPIAEKLLNYRWTTSAMLAWTARIAHVPIYRFEYGYTLLSFISSFGLIFFLSLMTGMRRIYALFVALAICVGFWAQFVLDTRAFSQIDALCMVLLLVLLIARIEGTSAKAAIGEYVLVGIILLAIILLYIEIIPLVVSGMAIFWGVKFLHKRYLIRKSIWYLLSFAIALAGVLPAKAVLFPYLKNQLVSAAGVKNDWHNYFFRWFYSDPVTGLWGLPSPQLVPIRIVISLLGILLSLLLLYAMINVIFFKKKEYPSAVFLIASFALASFIAFFYLFFNDRLWAAGKVLSVGYPYILLLPIAFGLTTAQDQTFTLSTALKKIIKGAIVLWILIQIALGIYRWTIPLNGKEYPKYIVHHDDYRRHDWNITALADALHDTRNASVWIAVSSRWVAEYLGFVFGDRCKLLNLSKIRYLEISPPMPAQMPQYLILDKVFNTDDMSSKFIAQNSELLLIKVEKKSLENLIVLGLFNPNGMEADSQGSSFFWMGGSATSLRLFSPRGGHVVLTAEFTMGPNLPERMDRRMIIYSHDKKLREIIITRQTKAIRIPVQKGLNEIKMEISDKPTIDKLYTGDTRPMLLGIHCLKIGLK
jgi:hypothetical protein